MTVDRPLAVLLFLHNQGQSTARTIAEAVGGDPRGMGQKMSAMAKSGLVERVNVDGGHEWALTDKGRKQAAALR